MSSNSICRLRRLFPLAKMSSTGTLKYIHLQVRNQQGVNANFEMKKSTRMRKLMAEYCRRFVPQGSRLRLLAHDVNMQFTKVIAPDDTADSLGLKEGGLLRAVINEGSATDHSSDDDILSEFKAGRERLTASQLRLSDVQVAELKAVFLLIDTDGTGVIPIDELQWMFASQTWFARSSEIDLNEMINECGLGRWSHVNFAYVLIVFLAWAKREQIAENVRITQEESVRTPQVVQQAGSSSGDGGEQAAEPPVD